MDRTEFGTAVAALLTDDQKQQIVALHAQVEEGWDDGCAARHEGAQCCVEAFAGTASLPGLHGGDCQCLVRDGAVLNVDLRCVTL